MDVTGPIGSAMVHLVHQAYPQATAGTKFTNSQVILSGKARS